MPVGIQRLNQRGGAHHPNDRIIFIKALPGPTQETALDFLNRIAAQCLPLMKQHSLSVMTLEEHEPNREFVGRNFNAGEIVQLVLHPLRSNGSNGSLGSEERWLPLKYVQMVMMHELAHCKEMNHSRAFWKVRNEYAGDMRGLWSKGYTGDGLWGRGQTLYSGQYADGETPDAADLPEHLCGGTYRSRGRKRKRGGKANGQELSHAERKQRWIEKKFGKEGESLGTDEAMRRYLEKGKTNASQPRVAKSKRGRDLRAEAVALRMKRAQAEREAEAAIKREDEEGQAEETTDDEDLDAVYAGGSKIMDSEGHDMVRVCEDEDTVEDEDARNEMAELSQMGQPSQAEPAAEPVDKHADPLDAAIDAYLEDDPTADDTDDEDGVILLDEDSTSDERDRDAVTMLVDTPSPALSRLLESKGKASSKGRQSPSWVRKSANPHHEKVNEDSPPERMAGQPAQTKLEVSGTSTSNKDPVDGNATTSAPTPTITNENDDTHPELPTLKLRPPRPQTCEICSMANEAAALTCAACAHVLDTTKLTRHWQCTSGACQGSAYINSDDVGRCGVCGAARPA